MAKSSKLAKKLVKKSAKKSVIARKIILKKPKKKTIKLVAVKAKRKKVLSIPKGYNSITPYLIVNNGGKAIDFYKKAFGAKEVIRMDSPGNKIGHAELKIGDTKIMLADECPEMDALSPLTVGGSPVSIHFYTKNVDEVVEKAVANGAKLLRPVTNMFYGDRSGTLEDPYGHKWHVSTHVEDVSPAKLKKRAAELYGNQSEKLS